MTCTEGLDWLWEKCWGMNDIASASMSSQFWRFFGVLSSAPPPPRDCGAQNRVPRNGCDFCLELNQMLLYSIPWAHPLGSSSLCKLWPCWTVGAPEGCPSRLELREEAGPWVAAWPGPRQ